MLQIIGLRIRNPDLTAYGQFIERWGLWIGINGSLYCSHVHGFYCSASFSFAELTPNLNGKGFQYLSVINRINSFCYLFILLLFLHALNVIGHGIVTLFAPCTPPRGGGTPILDQTGCAAQQGVLLQ